MAFHIIIEISYKPVWSLINRNFLIYFQNLDNFLEGFYLFDIMTYLLKIFLELRRLPDDLHND